MKSVKQRIDEARELIGCDCTREDMIRGNPQASHGFTMNEFIRKEIFIFPYHRCVRVLPIFDLTGSAESGII